MYRYLALPLLLLAVSPVDAQTVRGTVLSEDGILPGASVYWEGTTIGVNTDAEGHFSINKVRGHDRLVAAFIGYAADTITVSGSKRQVEFYLLADGLSIDAVTVSDRQRGTVISGDGVLAGQTITFAGLTKMACCTLAESFENSASVSVGYSDAVSGARQIRMLGLSGNYTQMLDENRPVMRGLGAPYGLSYTPGMWLRSIQVSKGTASVVNGHEGITGQINLEYRKPTDDEKFFLNGYLDQGLRAELNAASSLQINDRLSTVILAHGSIDDRKEDHNHDGFMDMPRTGQFNIANRWLYAVPGGVQLRAGVRYILEDRNGGHTDFRKSADRGRTERYGLGIYNRNLNGYLKAAFPIGRPVYDSQAQEELRSNLAIIADYNYYEQNSFFGIKDYNGSQNSAYANALYNYYIDPANRLTAGISFTYDNYDEVLQDRYFSASATTPAAKAYDLGRVEKEFGIFAEYNWSLTDKLNLIAGYRADYNDLHGWLHTPRAHLRWVVVDRLTVRGSVGKGYRSANPVTDNIGALATGRRISFADGLNLLEESLTYGGSITWNFRLGRDDNAALSFDFFRTQFTNQVVADQERDGEGVFFYNPAGTQFTNTFQGDFVWTPFTRFEVLATFRYSVAKVHLSGPDGNIRLGDRPLTDNFKTLINLQYATRFRKWVFDLTAQLNGRSRIPSTVTSHFGYNYSPVYPVFFAQVSRKFRNVDVYVGCENIGNYTQKHSVIAASDPFSTAFNSSVVWGPLMGRRVYGGFRLNL